MYDSIVILGPTATGKTALSIELAQKLNAEIVNADSMYIYKDLNIGTAKPTTKEMQGITHHLISFVDPKDSFNVAQYRQNAERTLTQLKNQNILPIIVGGTGLYIDSLVNDFSYGNTAKDAEIRQELQNYLEQFGNVALFEKLKELDPVSAQLLHPNDVKRVARAIEICLASGKKKSEIANEKSKIISPLIIGLTIPREVLYDRINQRVDTMVANNLIEEVRNLYDRGLTPENHQSMKGIGYDEIVDYFRGNYTLEQAIEKIKQHSRNYAKRQITWFKRNQQIVWFDTLSDKSICDKIINMYQLIEK